MPANKQNSETENPMGSGATSTRQVREENSAPNKMNNPIDSSVGKSAPRPARQMINPHHHRGI
jgi:hypothetical protein